MRPRSEAARIAGEQAYRSIVDPPKQAYLKACAEARKAGLTQDQYAEAVSEYKAAFWQSIPAGGKARVKAELRHMAAHPS